MVASLGGVVALPHGYINDSSSKEVPMAWVRIIPAEESTGDLTKAYERLNITAGPMTPPYEGLTNNGAALLKLMEFSSEARFGPSSLSRLQQEMVATYVSALNHCVF